MDEETAIKLRLLCNFSREFYRPDGNWKKNHNNNNREVLSLSLSLAVGIRDRAHIAVNPIDNCLHFHSHRILKYVNFESIARQPLLMLNANRLNQFIRHTKRIHIHSASEFAHAKRQNTMRFNTFSVHRFVFHFWNQTPSNYYDCYWWGKKIWIASDGEKFFSFDCDASCVYLLCFAISIKSSKKNGISIETTMLGELKCEIASQLLPFYFLFTPKCRSQSSTFCKIFLNCEMRTEKCQINNMEKCYNFFLRWHFNFGFRSTNPFSSPLHVR